MLFQFAETKETANPKKVPTEEKEVLTAKCFF